MITVILVTRGAGLLAGALGGGPARCSEAGPPPSRRPLTSVDYDFSAESHEPGGDCDLRFQGLRARPEGTVCVNLAMNPRADHRSVHTPDGDGPSF
jgi:hypothetical protein